MKPNMKRRQFIGTVVGTTLAGASLPAALAAPPSTSGPTSQARVVKDGAREVRLERLRPREIEQATAACPVLFQPLGTIEWHGRRTEATPWEQVCSQEARFRTGEQGAARPRR